MTKKALDKDRIARALGAKRRGRVEAKGGYFGALQAALDVRAMLKTPERGGRPTNPEWTERRLLPLSPETLERLEQMAAELGVSPMQVAGLIVERVVECTPGKRS